MLWPRYRELLDYDLEFGMEVGRRGKDISRAAARQHIFGFCIFDDVSAP